MVNLLPSHTNTSCTTCTYRQTWDHEVSNLPQMSPSPSSSEVWPIFNFILNYQSPPPKTQETMLNVDTTSRKNAKLAQTQCTIQLSKMLPQVAFSYMHVAILYSVSLKCPSTSTRKLFSAQYTATSQTGLCKRHIAKSPRT